MTGPLQICDGQNWHLAISIPNVSKDVSSHVSMDVSKAVSTDVSKDVSSHVSWDVSKAVSRAVSRDVSKGHRRASPSCAANVCF